jgi:hypothetical protein
MSWNRPRLGGQGSIGSHWARKIPRKNCDPSRLESAFWARGLLPHLLTAKPCRKAKVVSALDPDEPFVFQFAKGVFDFLRFSVEFAEVKSVPFHEPGAVSVFRHDLQ